MPIRSLMMDKNFIINIITRLYIYADWTKAFHYSTDSHAEHELCDTVRDDIVAFADDMSEMFFGLNGKPEVSDFSLEQAARQTNTPKTLKDLCQHVVDLVSYVRKNASDDSKGFYLQSLIDDFTGKMYKNIFLSTFDKSVRDEM